MRRYWVDKKCFTTNDQGDSIVVLVKDDFHHICGVCRRGLGDKFEVLTEDSKAYFVEIIDKAPQRALARVLESREVAQLPLPHIELCVSLPRFKKMDEIVEKAVEIGALRVRPFLSEYSFIRNINKLSNSKVERWSKIVKSATQQCGRGELMQVAPVQSLNELLKDFNQQVGAVGLLPYEGACEVSIKQGLNSLKGSLFNKLWLFIGSEGGFSENEVQLFKDNNIEPVTMGEQVLRVETACLAALSIIKYELVMS